MKALVGIDTASSWKPALNLLIRLWPENLEVVLVHCLESLLPDGSFPEVGPDHSLAIIQAERMRQGREALEEAAALLAGRGVKSSTRFDCGDPPKVLVHQADKNECQLIAVASSVKGFWGTALFGSTAKGVLIGAHQSVLVAKTPHSEDGPVPCVLATDHSQYMARCIDLLERIRPTGIGHLAVFTANETRPDVTVALMQDIPNLAPEANLWVHDRLVGLNEGLASRLIPLAESTEAMVSDMHPNEGIHEAMEVKGAELLIMGAQGHGFFERLTMGSKSLHECLNEPYSVLVLRA